MVTVFWDEKGLLLLEFMPQKTTITGQTYANTITALREAIKEKRRGKLSADVLLLHDNAPVHMSAKSEAAIRQCVVPTAKSPTLQYRPNSLGSFSIPSYEKFLRGKRFSSDEEVKEAVTNWFEEQSKDFSRGIK